MHARGRAPPRGRLFFHISLILLVFLPARADPRAADVHLDLDPGVSFRVGEVFSVSASPRLQARYEWSSRDGATPRALLDRRRLSVPRLRLKVGGAALFGVVRYKLELDGADLNLTAKDAFVDVGLPTGELRVMAGQYKKPFLRQQILSSARMQFVSRAITDRYYEAGRDVGATVHGGLFGRRLTYDLGLYVGQSHLWTAAGRGLADGTRPYAGVADPGRYDIQLAPRPMVVGRVSLYHGGYTAFDEADLCGGPLRVSVAAGGYSRFSGGDSSARTVAYTDFVVMAHHASLSGAVLASVAGGHGLWQSRPESIGGYLQAGYVVGGLVEPLARVARVHALDEQGRTEAGLGVVVYLVGHRVKWQSEALAFAPDRGKDEVRWRTQLQTAF